MSKNEDIPKNHRPKNLKTRPSYEGLRTILAEPGLELTHLVKLGISYKTIKKFKYDKEFVNLQTLCEICEYLNDPSDPQQNITFKRNDYNLADLCKFIPIETPPNKNT
ncbi:helix-turn-helix domain-containing protein [Alkalihalobacillus sp. NPDC078783]